MYHIELNEELIGPISLADLLTYDIQEDTLILKNDGNSDWVSAKDLPELKDLFAESDIPNEATESLTTYKLKQGDEVLGIFELEDIQLDTVNNETLIWTEGMDDWQNAYSFLGLNPHEITPTEEPEIVNSTDLYYIKTPNWTQIGPMSIDEINKIGIDENTLIWTEGMSNWKNAIDFLEDISSPPPPPPDENKMDTKRAIIIASASVLLLLIASYFAFPYFAKQENDIAEKIYKSYNKATVLVYNDFYYTINVDSKPILYIGRKNNNYDISDNPNGLQAITITGTGFFVSDDGNVITNRHVAYPWKSKSNEEFQINNPNVFQIYTIGVEYLIKQGIDISKISQSGINTFVGVCENNTRINGVKDFSECTIIKHHKNFEIDIAKLQLKSKNLPKGAIKIDVSNIADTQDLAVGTDVCILGFPGGLN